MSTVTVHPTSALKYPAVQNYVGGKFVDSGDAHLDVFNPADGQVISRVPLSTAVEVDLAVESARKAAPLWSATPIKERVQVFFRYKALLEQNIDDLAALVTEENGKLDSEARAEVLKSAELTEFACSLPQITAGEVLEVSRGVECRIERYPVGIVASITPFNFPNMVPNWTIPNAIALGNCMILKPSELVPISAGRIAELLREAGRHLHPRVPRRGRRVHRGEEPRRRPQPRRVQRQDQGARAPAAGAEPEGRPHPDRDQHPVEQGRRRRRHLPLRRRARQALRHRRARRRQEHHRVLPDR